MSTLAINSLKLTKPEIWIFYKSVKNLIIRFNTFQIHFLVFELSYEIGIVLSFQITDIIIH
jgi:hypothetical protein